LNTFENVHLKCTPWVPPFQISKYAIDGVNKNAVSAIMKQCSSVLPLLRHCLTAFDEICGTVMNLCFIVRLYVTLIKIANAPR